MLIAVISEASQQWHRRESLNLVSHLEGDIGTGS